MSRRSTPARHPLLERLAHAARKAPLIVGHRGASATCPENTLLAFRRAMREGAGVMEFDVHATRDGSLVVIHDETLDRTTNSRARLRRSDVRIDHVDLATIRTLDAGSWKAARFRTTLIPTLAETLRVLLPRCVPMIEHKGGAAELYVRQLEELGLSRSVILQSFDWDFVERVHTLAPQVALGVLGDGALTETRLRKIPRTGAGLVHWDVDSLRADAVERLHALGYLVCVYTANSDAELIGSAGMGVDLLTTNHPRRLAELVRVGAARYRRASAGCGARPLTRP